MSNIIEFPVNRTSKTTVENDKSAEVIVLPTAPDAKVIKLDRVIRHNAASSDTSELRAPVDRVSDRLDDYRESVSRDPNWGLMHETINMLESREKVHDLGAMFVGAMPALRHMSAMRDQADSETLDEMVVKFNHGEKPQSYSELRSFWARVYLQGSGEYFLSCLEETAEDSRETQLNVKRAMQNMVSRPVAFMNCLSAANKASGYAGYIENLSFADGYNPDAESYDIQTEVMRVLASDHIAKRPFATWYLMSKTYESAGEVSYMVPLIESIDESEVGLHATRDYPGLDELDTAVKRVVFNKWNRTAILPMVASRSDYNYMSDDHALQFEDTVLSTGTKTDSVTEVERIADAMVSGVRKKNA